MARIKPVEGLGLIRVGGGPEDRPLLRADIVHLQLRLTVGQQAWSDQVEDRAVLDVRLDLGQGGVIGIEQISPDADDRQRTGAVLGPSAFFVIGDGHGAGGAACHCLADLRLSDGTVDLRLEHAGKRADVGVHLVEKQVDASGGRFRIGADIVLVRLLQALADLCRSIAGQALHIEEGQSPGHEQVEEHGAADDKDELGAEGAQTEASGPLVERLHSGLRPDAAQIGQPA
ncbi:hypothetical protein ABIA18_001622 [Sinorhizobium fredii]